MPKQAQQSREAITQATVSSQPVHTGGFIPARYWLVVGIFLLSMLLYVDRVCISSAKDAIATDLGLSEKQMGWILSIFALGYALFQVPSGLLADRFGPRIILSAVVTFWSLFTALTAAAFNFISALIFRFLFGAGEAGAFPACARAIFSWIPMSERGLVQGVMFSGSRFGAAFALPVVRRPAPGFATAFGFVSLLATAAAAGFLATLAGRLAGVCLTTGEGSRLLPSALRIRSSIVFCAAVGMAASIRLSCTSLSSRVSRRAASATSASSFGRVASAVSSDSPTMIS